jgi:hypothetical protein
MDGWLSARETKKATLYGRELWGVCNVSGFFVPGFFLGTVDGAVIGELAGGLL